MSTSVLGATAIFLRPAGALSPPGMGHRFFLALHVDRILRSFSNRQNQHKFATPKVLTDKQALKVIYKTHNDTHSQTGAFP
jgi:hypothetical protein